MHSREEIIIQYQKSFFREDLPIISHFTFIKGFDFEKHLDSLIEQLVNEDLVMKRSDGYHLTDEGERDLKRKLSQERYHPV